MPQSLREQQAETARRQILNAVTALLEQSSVDALTMPRVADLSGVSLRTLYRYYPTREQLLEAAGRWIGSELLGQGYPQSLDEVADSFEDGCRQFDRHPGLVRALALSELGRGVRGYRRGERLDAIGNALHKEVGDLPEEELRRAGAVLAYLHNMLAYTTLRDEQGLQGKEIGKALGWAIRTLVDDLRRQQRTRGKRQ
jgi:TetR/AcrR family transcriptional regulator, cholesterol catabolism regulator